MKDPIERIKRAIEKNDVEEIENVTAELWLISLSKSLFEQLDSAYFPGLCSTLFKDEASKQKAVDKLQMIASGKASFLFEPYDEEGIKEITDYDYITLFEVSLLIGYRVDSDPRMLVFKAPGLFCDAIVNGHIDPREPRTHIPFSKLHKSAFVIGDEMAFEKDCPDLSWQLTLKEAAEFAILKGYPEHLFTDLLSDAPTEAVIQDAHKKQCIDKKPAYLDENHPAFSIELSIAIKAWEQVLSGNPARPKVGSRKALIEKWLQEHHKELSESARNRITTLINPDKSGGVSPLN